jgi:hypothetical protein
MHVTLSVGSSFLIALVIVVVLSLFIGIVLWAGRQPYFRRQKPTRMQRDQPVTGGVHQGDPRSMSPHRDEVVDPPDHERRR